VSQRVLRFLPHRRRSWVPAPQKLAKREADERLAVEKKGALAAAAREDAAGRRRTRQGGARTARYAFEEAEKGHFWARIWRAKKR
jgi:hypothetical protein